MAAVVADRPSHPVLANFLIAIDGETISIRGTDLISAIVRTVAIELEEIGEAFCLPKKLTLELMSSFVGDGVEIEIEDGDTVASLKCDTAEIKIQTMTTDEFPAMPAVSQEVKSITLPVKDLSEAINRVIPMASIDETKMILRGVHLQGDGNTLEMQTTDGHCLSIVSIESELELEGLTFLPNTLQTIITNANKSQVEEIELRVSETEIVSSFSDFYYSGRILQGEYPKIRRLIPSNYEYSIEVNRKDFLDAIELVSIVASREGKNSLITFQCEDGEMSVESIVVDSGTAKQVIKYSGSDSVPKIGFNAKYLLKAVKFHGTENITINISGLFGPTTLTSSKDDSIYLIMPVQLR